jgi:hypothetical protein
VLFRSNFNFEKTKSGCCDDGYRRIRVYAAKNKYSDGTYPSGYHFQREEADGTWTEQEAGFPAQACKVDWQGNPVLSPYPIPNVETLELKPCGYLCAPKDG